MQPPTSDYEKQFYVRFIKFLLFNTILFSLIFLGVQKGSVFYFLLSGFLLLFCCFYSFLQRTRENDLSNILTEEELADMQNNMDSDEEEGDMSPSERMARHPIEQSPKLVRSCREEINYIRPKSGRYSVVYNAVYFGKSIRSESELHLHFEEAKASNGWEITGYVVSGGKKNTQVKRPIADGFTNARGETYWRLSNPDGDPNSEGIYRGFLDLRSSALYDGDFRVGSAPPGRIVRMELVEEEEEGRGLSTGDDWGSADIDGEFGTHEMVELS